MKTYFKHIGTLAIVLLTCLNLLQAQDSTKIELQPITDAIDKLAGLNAFYIIKDGKTYAVMDINRIEQALPGTIETDSTGKKTIDFEQLGAMTIAAMKDQQMIIDEQEARIKQLEAFETDRKVMESELIKLSSDYLELLRRVQRLETKETLTD